MGGFWYTMTRESQQTYPHSGEAVLHVVCEWRLERNTVGVEHDEGDRMYSMLGAARM